MSVIWPNIPDLADLAGYVGLPYRERGRDRSGLDCWGLNVVVYRDRFGVTVPDHGPAFAAVMDPLDAADPARQERAFVRLAQKLIRDQKKTWTEIKTPVLGATVLVRRSGQPVHTGIYLTGGDLLHADFEIGSVVRERLSRLADVVEGYFIPPGVPVSPEVIR